jgi:cytidylate kinase
MAIVSISRGSHSRGVEVAELVASRLGYKCLARDVVLDAAAEFNVSERELLKAIEDSPSIFERLTQSKARVLAFIRAALLKQFREDNLVYHGLAGHVFLQGIRHAFKARILSDLEDRVAMVMAQDKVSEQTARGALKKRDKARKQWSMQLYGVDPEDPSLYDMVIHVGKMGTEGAANAICDLVSQEAFQTTPESQAGMEDLALAAAVEALIVEMQLEKHLEGVTASEGKVIVRLKSLPRVQAGSFKDFGAHYIDDLQGRLNKRALGLHNFKALEISAPDLH